MTGESTEPTIETLPRTPVLAPILARSVLGGKKSGRGELPTTRLRVENVRIDRDHLTDYERLCGFTVDDVLPHTYPHVLGFGLQAELMARRSFPLPLAGLVHIENEIKVRRRLTAQDELTLTVHAERMRAHPKGTQVDLVTEVTVDGESAWSGRSTYLKRGKGDPEAERGAAAPPMPTGFAAAQWSLDGGLGRRYGAVSGDVNPIHLHPLTAKAMGFPRAIAHGMWTYARVLGALGRRPEGPSTSHVWFKKPVLLPGKVDLVVSGTVADGQVAAGLRDSRRPKTEHLVLTLD